MSNQQLGPGQGDHVDFMSQGFSWSGQDVSSWDPQIQDWHMRKDEHGHFRCDWGRHRWSTRGAGLSHVQVPRRVNLEEWSKDQGGDERITTLMVRNVPNRYDRTML